MIAYICDQCRHADYERDDKLECTKVVRTCEKCAALQNILTQAKLDYMQAQIDPLVTIMLTPEGAKEFKRRQDAGEPFSIPAEHIVATVFDDGSKWKAFLEKQGVMS